MVLSWVCIQGFGEEITRRKPLLVGLVPGRSGREMAVMALQKESGVGEGEG